MSQGHTCCLWFLQETDIWDLFRWGKIKRIKQVRNVFFWINFRENGMNFATKIIMDFTNGEFRFRMKIDSSYQKFYLRKIGEG